MFKFLCRHPAGALSVQKPETSKPSSEDFDVVTYHLRCGNCGKQIGISYAKMRGGVNAYLKRGHDKMIRNVGS